MNPSRSTSFSRHRGVVLGAILASIPILLAGCDDNPLPAPIVEPEPVCPAAPPWNGEDCAEEGLECIYARGECPCGDPSDYFICEGGAFVENGSESGCEYAANQCNGAVCRAGPGGACDEEGESCWFVDPEDEDDLPLFRRWLCADGVLVVTADTHRPVF